MTGGAVTFTVIRLEIELLVLPQPLLVAHESKVSARICIAYEPGAKPAVEIVTV